MRRAVVLACAVGIFLVGSSAPSQTAPGGASPQEPQLWQQVDTIGRIPLTLNTARIGIQFERNVSEPAMVAVLGGRDRP